MSDQTIQFRRNNGRGIALAITLVVLVSLAVITTILALRVSQVSQRQQYIMDYQKARYGADSALKYIFSVLPETKTDYADRSDAADSSDLFWLNKPDYLKYLTAWAQTATPEQLEKYLKPSEDQDSPAVVENVEEYRNTCLFVNTQAVRIGEPLLIILEDKVPANQGIKSIVSPDKTGYAFRRVPVEATPVKLYLCSAPKPQEIDDIGVVKQFSDTPFDNLLIR